MYINNTQAQFALVLYYDGQIKRSIWLNDKEAAKTAHLTGPVTKAVTKIVTEVKFRSMRWTSVNKVGNRGETISSGLQLHEKKVTGLAGPSPYSPQMKAHMVENYSARLSYYCGRCGVTEACRIQAKMQKKKKKKLYLCWRWWSKTFVRALFCFCLDLSQHFAGCSLHCVKMS